MVCHHALYSSVLLIVCCINCLAFKLFLCIVCNNLRINTSYNGILRIGDVACDLGSTHNYVLNSLQSKANVCLICIESIKKTEPVSC